MALTLKVDGVPYLIEPGADKDIDSLQADLLTVLTDGSFFAVALDPNGVLVINGARVASLALSAQESPMGGPRSMLTFWQASEEPPALEFHWPAKP